MLLIVLYNHAPTSAGFPPCSVYANSTCMLLITMLILVTQRLKKKKV